jgi:hypothetical protein
MARHNLLHDVVTEGFLFRVERARGGVFLSGPRDVPFDLWLDDLHPGIPLLRLLAANEAAVPGMGKLLVPHPIMASLAPAEAQALGIPPPCPHALRLETRSTFSDDRFSVCPTWIDGAGAVISGLQRTGASISTVVEQYTVREPLFTLLEAVERLNLLEEAQGTTGLDARMVQLGHVKRALEAAIGDASADRYLSRLTISHATGIGVNVLGARDDPFFEPELYGDVPRQPDSAENEDAEVERQPLLPSEQAERFRERLFPAQGAWSHYTLGKGTYVVLDAPVVAALRIVQRVNKEDIETRSRFRGDPNSFLIPKIQAAGGNGDVLCGGSALAPDAVAGYGNRVLGIVEWAGKAFSFKIPVHQQWFPGEDGEEVYPIDVPGSEEPLVVRQSELDTLIRNVEAAQTSGASTFEHHGRTYPLAPDGELARTLTSLAGYLTPDRPNRGQSRPREPSGRLVLRVAENEEDLTYNARLRDPDGRLAGKQLGDTAGLKSTPDAHQSDGIAWLKTAFLSGMPGVLLADDMGLGKTLQVLYFLHWLRERSATDGRPILVVAPAKLLEEWREQIAIHLPPMALGQPLYAYERELRHITLERGNETELGRATLDIERLRQSDLIITTYETLRDHQFSFAKVHFRVSVFDEAQKIKSGTSLMNHAAKAQQPDFAILMTGTPVENSTMDIWTLLDVAWPGFLELSGKDFVERYGDGSDVDLMVSLKERLITPQNWGTGDAARKTPAVMLRRFKADVLTALAPKEERTWQEEMPAVQARAYDAIVAAMKTGTVPAHLALQSVRRICLHPELRVPRDDVDRRTLIDSSARFRALFRILREARSADLGVLVFVDILKAQDMLQVMIRDEFHMPQLPDVINGRTDSHNVRDIKKRFQAGTGFGVLILGPRAAGFGLTLTRATQVVHLNRWWNPAVEDQCSDRTHRKGQDKHVTIHIPLAVHPMLREQSFDLVLDGLLTHKRSLSRQIVVPSCMSQRELAELLAQVASSGLAQDKELLRALDAKDWRSFELWVAGRFQAAGWQVSDTPLSGDGCADVIARHPRGGRHAIIQIKHRSSEIGTVDEGAVKEVLRAPDNYRRSHPWLVQPEQPVLLAISNGAFELAARTLAAQRGVRIVDRAEIVGLEGIARELIAAGRI